MNIRELESLSHEELIELIQRERESIGAGGVPLMGDAGRIAALERENATLRAVAQAVANALTLYERYGEICPFEGEPMIYASTLDSLGELARTALAQEQP